MNRVRARIGANRLGVLALLAAGVLVAGLLSVIVWSGVLLSPQAVVKEYVTSFYARDYSRVYELISTADRSYKTREEYLRENDPFTGFALEVARRLASYIEYQEIQVDRQGAQATVTAQLIVPDGNAEVVREILFGAGRDGDGLSSTERSALLGELERLRESDQLPTFLVEQTFALVREQGRWRIFENWDAAVRVHFSGEVKDELPWEFTPVQAVVLAKPGETLQTVYRVKNLSDQPVTAKARHIDEPEEYVNYLDTIQCFCFIQQTLAPGEEMELPLRFRVAWDVPPEVKEFYVHYEFYPIESFPGE